ncbi:MAG: protein-L-isoaspartate(D-aspartate) O-methyltransferase [Anaerolineales bacterium]|nr:protein-L-isoaspartate(D-aspartate) O-methyltransferase [Anaerolineales bacterium]MDW8227843.1 protein-L-isoaspartate(D-aspartate) O-methyltransferase [Anaerolineales bacterium]
MSPEPEDEYTLQRKRMVREQIQGRGLHNPRLLAAFESVPRHLFVPPDELAWAYSDGPLPIGEGQTISQPYIVALMTDLLDVQPTDRVLEVGTGSGYQAAILGKLAAEVHTIELIPSLAQQAEERLRRLGLTNVHVHVGDGSQGWPEAAPYDGILVAAAGPEVPPPLLEQLAEGGRLVAPVGGRYAQVLEIVERKGEEFIRRKDISVAFVPLRGKYGWK